MNYSRHDERAQRRSANLLLTESAQASTSCGHCGAEVGYPCLSTSGVEIPSSVDAPGCHKDRLTKLASRSHYVTQERPTYVTVTDLTHTYGVSPSTIYRRVKDGTLTAYKLGHRTIRFDAAEVEAAFRGSVA